MKHTPLPWITDDRHIHPDNGRLTYPRGQEPETDVIVQVDTDLHENALLNETDKANLALIVRAVNTIDEVTKQRDVLLAACGSAGLALAQWEVLVEQFMSGHIKLRPEYSESEVASHQARVSIRQAINLCEQGGVKS